ncbi:hypothetical protein AAVH_16653 [Aphelenchoides avenae]|nr:hypothetical protein AAVH_16653 [Aphelenchus avenae]
MLCPLVLMAVPVIYPLYATIVNTRVSLAAVYVCLLCMSLFPLMNALLTVVFVKPYRTHTLHWMRVVFKGSAVSHMDSRWESSASHQAVARRRTVAFTAQVTPVSSG